MHLFYFFNKDMFKVLLLYHTKLLPNIALLTIIPDPYENYH